MSKEAPYDSFSITLTVDVLMLASGVDDQEFAYLPRPDDGLWHQFAMIYDGSMTILLDGEVVVGGATITAPILSSASSYK